MKHFYFFLLLIIISFQIYISGQTFTEPPGPENVLVVYNLLDQASIDVKEYYISARNIPAVNVVGLEWKNSV